MKTIPKTLIQSVLTLLIALAVVSPASAFPPLPSSFYGTVKVNGQKVPDGTLVEAMINGQVYATGYTRSYENNSVYSLDIPGDDSSSSSQKEGGVEREAVSFEVGGAVAGQTGVWSSGTNVKLDLTVTATTPILDPVKTPTPIPTQTAIVKPTNRPTRAATEAPATSAPAANPNPTRAVQVSGPTASAPTANANAVVADATRAPAAGAPVKQPGGAIAQAATRAPAAPAQAGQPTALPPAQGSDPATAQPAAPVESAARSSGMATVLIVAAVAIFASLAWIWSRRNHLGK